MPVIPFSLAVILRVVAVGSVAMLTGTLVLRGLEQSSTRHLPALLAALPSADVALACRNTASLGPAGETALVELLGHPRHDLAQASELALENVLAGNGSRRSSEPPDIAGLLMRLASGVERLDDRGRERAARLAQRALALQHPLEPRALADAERIVRAAIASQNSPSTDAAILAETPGAKETVDPKAATIDDGQTSLAPKEASEPARLIVEEAPTLKPSQTATRDAGTLRTIAVQDDLRQPLRRTSSQGLPLPRTSHAAFAPSAASTNAEPASSTAPVAPAETASEYALERDPTYQLFVQLHGPDQVKSSRARSELERLGLSPAQIAIAGHLTSTDPQERQTWAERLPGMRSFPSKPWLMVLSRDQDALVRRTALSLLATASDHELQARVREMAATDPDEQVRAQAEAVATRQQAR